MGQSKQTSSVTLPTSITNAANQNVALASQVAAMPYMPNFGAQVAAMTPAQKAGYAGVQGMASAFGMPHTGTSDADMGLPTAITNPDGTSGYSTKGLYEQMMAGLTPAMQAILAQFRYNPQTGANPLSPNMTPSPIPMSGASPAVGSAAPAAGVRTAAAPPTNNLGQQWVNGRWVSPYGMQPSSGNR